MNCFLEYNNPAFKDGSIWSRAGYKATIVSCKPFGMGKYDFIVHFVNEFGVHFERDIWHFQKEYTFICQQK